MLFVNIGHWFLLATVNIPLHSVLVKGVSALINSALINLFPNPLLIRRLGCGRCPFRLTVVELGTKLFIKRAQLDCYNVLPSYGMITLILTENQREFIRQFVLVFILDSKQQIWSSWTS